VLGPGRVGGGTSSRKATISPVEAATPVLRLPTASVRYREHDSVV
jgi:hypothetical protein